MIISDLNYLENVFEGPGVVGGYIGQYHPIYFSLSQDLQQTLENKIKEGESGTFAYENTKVSLVTDSENNYAYSTLSKGEYYVSASTKIRVTSP